VETLSAMISALHSLLMTLRTLTRSRAALQLEILALRHHRRFLRGSDGDVPARVLAHDRRRIRHVAVTAHPTGLDGTAGARRVSVARDAAVSDP